LEKHWRMADVAWDKFDPDRVDPAIVPLIKAAAMVERNGEDYARYLANVFPDDALFRAAAEAWAVEEVQHGDALGRWAMLADPGWDFPAAFARYRAGYQVPLDATSSVRGSRAGELIARCMVETGTSSYYSALGEATQEPVLKEICRRIAADEFRHYKLFYDYLRRYLGIERIGRLRRLRIALGRIGESEDDELAFAYHCGNEPEGTAFVHRRCTALYMGRAMAFYRYHNVARGVGMILKAVGLPARGRIFEFAARGTWWLIRRRRRRFAAEVASVT
jgi:rubrerythrin